MINAALEIQPAAPENRQDGVENLWDLGIVVVKQNNVTIEKAKISL